jgi:hypothetical protein
MSFSFVSPSKVAPIRVVSNTRIACDQHRIVFGPICASGSRSDLSRAIPPGAIPSGAIPCGARSRRQAPGDEPSPDLRSSPARNRDPTVTFYRCM